MSKQTKKIVAYIILIAAFPILYGIGELFYEINPDKTIVAEGYGLIAIKTATGFCIALLIYLLYILINLIVDNLILPILDKIFKDN